MKNINIKIPESELKRLNYYKSFEGNLQADFIRAAIGKYCDDLRLTRAGGLVLTIPNPSMAGMPWGTPDQKATVLEILKQADADLAKAGFVGSGLSDYASWLEYHLLEKTEAEQQRFEQNFERDHTIEMKINTLVDAEWKARWGEDQPSED